jgi:hypothetical protein
MPVVRVLRSATVLALLLLAAACAERPAGGPAAPDPDPVAAAQLPDAGVVLQVGFTGGFVTPETTMSRLPVASVHADGRVFVEGPVPAVYPGPAWPNVQVVQIDRARVQELADRALAAGVAGTTDLGTPPLADVPSTRFTLVTATATHVREVYGLRETAGMPGSGLTPAQEAARARLGALLDEVSDLALAGPGDGSVPQPWTPSAVSVLARPWTPPAEDVLDLVPPPQPWPGPPLPGPLVGTLDLGCVTATGEQAAAVVEAARAATTLTSWLTPDGARWTVTFRPLLPHEGGCADLGG